MAVIWGPSVYERIRQGMKIAWVTCDIILGKICEVHCFAAFSAHLALTLCPPPLTISVTESHFFTFVFLFLFPCPATMLASHFFYVHPLDFFFRTPFFPCSNPLLPSLLLLLCQISLSTLSKLHFSDYTPIKGPVGTLFACCILSLETETWTVCVCARTCVWIHSKKSYLIY